MKRVKNSIFITKQGVYLHKDGEAIAVNQRDDAGINRTLLKLPLLAIQNIYCFGNITVSPYLMGYCGEHGIVISFFNASGKFQASVLGPDHGSILVRIKQYQHFFDSTKTTSLVKNIIGAKIASERQLILRHLRTYGENEFLTNASYQLKNAILKLKTCTSVDLLRGYEGEAAKIYFSCFPYLLRNKDFEFNERSRRPPNNPINALLSFFYTILQQNIASALIAVGLDCQLGYLHRPRAGRNSLALDLLEELRAPIVDRFVLTLVNRSQVSHRDFIHDDIQGCQLTDSSKRKVLELWQARKLKEVIHPYLKEKIYAGNIPNIQASLLASYFRGDLAVYPPYISR